MNKTSNASASVALSGAALKTSLSTNNLHRRLTRMRKKSQRRQLFHYGLLAGNLLLVGVVGYFIATASSSDRTGSAASNRVSGVASAAAASSASAANPLDQLSSADIAVNIARAANMPEATPITSQAISEDVALSVSQSSEGLVAKTQVVATSLKSNKDIRDYVAQNGETAASIAAKFGVTTDSILWSNNLASDMVSPGQRLVVPPISGIVHTVKAGDTPESLAEKFQASKDKIIVTNDAELSGLQVGARALIPDGRIQRAATVSPRGYGGSSMSSFPWGGGPVYGGANGYDYGYCTWYVAHRINVPSNWGNANTWDNLAPRSGWAVSSAPRVGAIAQTDRGGLGHVAVVTAVSPDGTQIKYADMNGVAGWGREGHSGWVSVGRYEHYIYR